MKILSIIAILGLTILPVTACSKKINEPTFSDSKKSNQVSEINLTEAEFTIWKNEAPYKPARTSVKNRSAIFIKWYREAIRNKPNKSYRRVMRQ